MQQKKYHLDFKLHPQGDTPLVGMKEVKLRDRLLTKLLGRKRSYYIIVPTDAIAGYSFTEVKGGNADV